jgi:acetolactate synthase-1/2/3 large subunit
MVLAESNTSASTVSDVIAAALARHGVEVTFGQSLPSAVQLALSDRSIRQFSYRTENAGSYMADAYARISRKVGVVTAQNGPAATLLVPGLAEALKASVPVVALVQDVPMRYVGKNAFQEFDHARLFSSCTKWFARLDDPARVDDYIDAAFTAAASGRAGPSVLMLPMDLQVMPATSSPSRAASLGTFPLDRSIPAPDVVRRAAEILRSARNPVVVAGGGIHLSDASSELARLQEVASLPVATTAMGKGSVAETHPLTIGVAGYLMGRHGATQPLRGLVQEAEVVLLVGTRTNQNGTDTYSLFNPKATFIHIDVDPTEIGRNFEAVRLVGDAKLGLEALIAALEAGSLAQRREARPAVEAAIARGREAHERSVADLLASTAAPVRPERLMADMRRVLTGNTIVCADASYSSVWMANYLRAAGPGARFLSPRGLAGLGWGMPMAMGAKVAAPEATVLALVGDGGFAHVWSELETAVRTRTPVVVTVLNNGVLGYQKDAEDCRHGRHTDACYFEPVDHAAIARACGAMGLRVERAADYAAALREAIAADVPCVIDVVTDPMAYPPLTAFDDKLESVRAERMKACASKQAPMR